MEDGRNWPKISIVTPSYNYGHFIEETVRSVLLQGYPNLEYIVIDGGSDDNSMEILNEYAPWISYWISEPDDGQSNGLNKGFKQATGEIFAYINSDDMYCRDAFRNVGNELSGKTHLPLVVSFPGLVFDDQARTSFLPAQIARPQLHVWLCSDASLFQASTFWTRKLHKEVGGFNEDLHFCLDKEFFLKAMYEFGTYKGKDGAPVAMFRHHTSAKTATMEDAKWKENKILWRRYRSTPPYVHILAEEYRILSGACYMQNVFSNLSTIQKLASLFRAALCCPHYLGTRFYWGAIRKTFLGDRK